MLFIVVAEVYLAGLLSTFGAAMAREPSSVECIVSLEDVRETVEETSLSLRVELTNRSATEIYYGSLRLTREDSQPEEAGLIAEFDGLSMATRGSLSLERSLNLVPQEQDGFLDDSSLSGELSYVDENGVPRELRLGCEMRADGSEQ